MVLLILCVAKVEGLELCFLCVLLSYSGKDKNYRKNTGQSSPLQEADHGGQETDLQHRAT